MKLMKKQLAFYRENGYLFFPNHLSQAEVVELRAELPVVFQNEGPSRVMEKDGSTIRSVYGCHTSSEVFQRLVRHSRMLQPAQSVLQDPVYVYQFKINVKAAFSGDVWQWHQDYIFWLKEDGMPKPNVTNAVVFLDEVTELNGPIFLLPGSHREGVIEPPAASSASANERVCSLTAYQDSPSWISNLTADLRYSLNHATIAALIARYGAVGPKGPAGSVLFFHPNVVHGSPSNISPFNRTLILITYNSTNNIPTFPGPRRPDFLVSANYAALEPVS